MNGAKQFEPWPTEAGPLPLVAASFDAIEKVCDKMIVVLGHRADEVATLLADRPFHRVDSDPDAPMFESIRAGLSAACDLAPNANILLHPGDHPEVANTTLNHLIDVGREHNKCAVLPEHKGQGGHPVLIPPSVLQQILSAKCPQGLRGFWLNHPGHCQRLDVDDPSCIRDVDYCLNRPSMKES